LGRRNADSENKIAMLSQELERLNGVIEKKNNEIRALGGEVQDAQENLRLSAAQTSKLQNELSQYKSQFQATNEESETYRQRIQKLLSENTNLGDEVRNAQENLRLSASQIGKLNNEYKIACNEIEEYKRRLDQAGDLGRRNADSENKIAMLTQ
jgi:chromosome segregation ATPase